jgi:hypothetical protein
MIIEQIQAALAAIGLYTVEDYAIVGLALVGGSLLLMATVEYLNWRDWRYY